MKARIIQKGVSIAVWTPILWIGLWGVCPFGGKTLPHLLAGEWQISFTLSAFLFSVLVGVLSMIAIVGFSLGRKPLSEDIESNMRRR